MNLKSEWKIQEEMAEFQRKKKIELAIRRISASADDKAERNGTDGGTVVKK